MEKGFRLQIEEVIFIKDFVLIKLYSSRLEDKIQSWKENHLRWTFIIYSCPASIQPCGNGTSRNFPSSIQICETWVVLTLSPRHRIGHMIPNLLLLLVMINWLIHSKPHGVKRLIYRSFIGKKSKKKLFFFFSDIGFRCFNPEIIRPTTWKNLSEKEVSRRIVETKSRWHSLSLCAQLVLHTAITSVSWANTFFLYEQFCMGFLYLWWGSGYSILNYGIWAYKIS